MTSMRVRRSADAYEEHPCKSRDETVLSDDAHALNVLYEQFSRLIHSYLYRLLGSQEDADDVTQEVFVRLFTAWDGLYDRDNLTAWLYRIATNLSIDLLRRRKRLSWWSLTPRKRDDGHYSDALSDESFLSPPDNGDIPEIAEREHIRLAIANMPEDYAVALVLHVAQGVPYQEVAAIVGISPNAAATRISRAKKLFGEQFIKTTTSIAQYVGALTGQTATASIPCPKESGIAFRMIFKLPFTSALMRLPVLARNKPRLTRLPR